MQSAELQKLDTYYKKRYLSAFSLVVAFVALLAASSSFVDFDPVQSLLNLPGGFVWLADNFMPTERSFQYLPKILGALGATFLDAVAASVVAALLSFVLAVIGSRVVGFGGIVQIIVRGIATVLRNIPTVAWAFILLFTFRQSEITGWIVLFLKSFGFLTRTFLENIEESAQGPLEAAVSCGATRLQMIAHVIIPNNLPMMVSWVLYQMETNIRDATLVGMLTGTGIGFVFQLYYCSFRYDTAGLVILCIMVVAILCEAVSNYVRRRVM